MTEEHRPFSEGPTEEKPADGATPSNVLLLADYARVSEPKSASGRDVLTITMARQNFRALQEIYPDATPEEIVNHALALFLYAGQRIKEGRIIASVDEGKKSYAQIEHPLFAQVPRNNAEIKPFPGTPKPE